MVDTRCVAASVVRPETAALPAVTRSAHGLHGGRRRCRRLGVAALHGHDLRRHRARPRMRPLHRDRVRIQEGAEETRDLTCIHARQGAVNAHAYILRNYSEEPTAREPTARRADQLPRAGHRFLAGVLDSLRRDI